MARKIIKYFSQCRDILNDASVGSGDYISSQKSKGLSDENITALSAPNNFVNHSLEYLGTNPRVRFSGSCIKQNAITTIAENQ